VAGALRRRGARLGGRGGIGPLRALNLLRGALDARLHPELIEEGLIRMVERLRGSVLCVLYGYAAFVVAGIGYQKLTEYEDFTEAANRHAALGATFRTIVVASVVSLVAMVAAATPIGLATVRQALAGRRALWAPLAVLAVALLWIAGTLALMAWRARSSPVPPGPMAGVGEISGWLASLPLAAAVGVAAAVTAVRRSEPDGRLHGAGPAGRRSRLGRQPPGRRLTPAVHRAVMFRGYACS
jgi:hypothetical protein